MRIGLRPAKLRSSAVVEGEAGISQGIFLADGENLDSQGGGVVTRRPVVADSDEIRVSVFASHP